MPKRCQNDPVIIPEWSKHVCKQISKWSQYDSKTIPKQFQNNLKTIMNHPKPSQSYPKVYQNDPEIPSTNTFQMKPKLLETMSPKRSQINPEILAEWLQSCFNLSSKQFLFFFEHNLNWFSKSFQCISFRMLSQPSYVTTKGSEKKTE